MAVPFAVIRSSPRYRVDPLLRRGPGPWGLTCRMSCSALSCSLPLSLSRSQSQSQSAHSSPSVSGKSWASGSTKCGTDECPRLSMPTDPDVETADLCLGCFWAPDVFFSNLDGVLEVVVGYSGGKQPNPTYKNIKDHTETVRVVYDPLALSYEELLEYYFEQLGGPPQGPPMYRQYRSALFVHSPYQQHAIDDKFFQLAKTHKTRRVFIDVEPASEFYRAEEYHQKYLVKRVQRLAAANVAVQSSTN